MIEINVMNRMLQAIDSIVKARNQTKDQGIRKFAFTAS